MRAPHSRSATASRTVLFAHPSADLYGADLQLLESVSSLVEREWRVVVTMPADGPLCSRLAARGAEVRFVDFPVLRRSSASASGVFHLVAACVRSAPSMRRLLRDLRPALLVVNTATLPWWHVAGTLQRVASLSHVHEAETEDSLPVRLLLWSPLLLARAVVVNSEASAEAARSTIPFLRRRIHLIYNGVPEPEAPLNDAPTPKPLRAVVVGRLSPRKAQHVALEAVATARARGVDVELEVCGTTFSGYEWYEQQLRARAQQQPLNGHVRFSGYVTPIWTALERAAVLIAPSLREPFGNAVIEAQLAGRAVIASAAYGHVETVTDEVTGLLTEPGDPAALAAAIERLAGAPALVSRLARQGRTAAQQRFSVTRYRAQFGDLVRTTATGKRRRTLRRAS